MAKCSIIGKQRLAVMFGDSLKGYRLLFFCVDSKQYLGLEEDFTAAPVTNFASEKYGCRFQERLLDMQLASSEEWLLMLFERGLKFYSVSANKITKTLELEFSREGRILGQNNSFSRNSDELYFTTKPGFKPRS